MVLIKYWEMEICIFFLDYRNAIVFVYIRVYVIIG